ncbi:hypothetical protein Tco_0516122 [Tanacetum coccineum]
MLEVLQWKYNLIFHGQLLLCGKQFQSFRTFVVNTTTPSVSLKYRGSALLKSWVSAFSYIAFSPSATRSGSVADSKVLVSMIVLVTVTVVWSLSFNVGACPCNDCINVIVLYKLLLSGSHDQLSQLSQSYARSSGLPSASLKSQPVSYDQQHATLKSLTSKPFCLRPQPGLSLAAVDESILPVSGLRVIPKLSEVASNLGSVSLRLAEGSSNGGDEVGTDMGKGVGIPIDGAF